MEKGDHCYFVFQLQKFLILPLISLHIGPTVFMKFSYQTQHAEQQHHRNTHFSLVYMNHHTVYKCLSLLLDSPRCMSCAFGMELLLLFCVGVPSRCRRHHSSSCRVGCCALDIGWTDREEAIIKSFGFPSCRSNRNFSLLCHVQEMLCSSLLENSFRNACRSVDEVHGRYRISFPPPTGCRDKFVYSSNRPIFFFFLFLISETLLLSVCPRPEWNP